jgi:O-antigen/teichoic acid export membrane protein
MWGFALADGMPMIFMTSIGLLILIWDIVYEGHKNNRISAGVALLFTIYLFVTLIVSATAVNYILYVILFAFPLLPILIYMIYYYINYNKLSTIQDLTNENYKKVRKVILNAIITGIVGFIMWLIDQLVCPHFQPIVYLWGHAIWHVLIGYFAMSMITFASHIYANNYNQQSNIIYAYKIFPLSKWE